MRFVTITKNGRTKKMTESAWENNMPKDKDGWAIKPEAPKEIKEAKKVIVESAPEIEIESPIEALLEKSEEKVTESEPEEAIKPEAPKKGPKSKAK